MKACSHVPVYGPAGQEPGTARAFPVRSGGGAKAAVGENMVQSC